MAHRSHTKPVRPVRLSIVERRGVAVRHIEACSAPDVQKGGVFPPAEKGVYDAIRVAQETPSTANRQFRVNLGIPDMRDVLLCGAVVLIDVCLVEIVSVDKVAAMRVAGIDANSVFEIRGESNRQRVVPAAGDRFGDRNIAQLRIFGIKRTLRGCSSSPGKSAGPG